MAFCRNCGADMGAAKNECPACGHLHSEHLTDDVTSEKSPGLLLCLGIFLLPVLAFVLLREGYSKTSRIIAFGWLVIVLVAGGSANEAERVDSALGSVPSFGSDRRSEPVASSAAPVVLSSPEPQQNQSAPPRPSRNPVYSIGQTVDSSNLSVSIASVKASRSVGDGMFASQSAEGVLFVTVDWSLKNISDRPIEAFDLPKIYLVDTAGVSFEPDLAASMSYATEANISRKIVSNLNPGIAITDADAWELSEQAWNSGGWSVRVATRPELLFSLD